MPRVLFALAVGLLLAALGSCARVAAALVSGGQAALACAKPDPALQRTTRSALDHEDAADRLDALARVNGWDVVRCAVEAILSALTAAQQDGELGAQSTDFRAHHPHLQPVVDRGRAWLGRTQR